MKKTTYFGLVLSFDRTREKKEGKSVVLPWFTCPCLDRNAMGSRSCKIVLEADDLVGVWLGEILGRTRRERGKIVHELLSVEWYLY